MQDDQALAERCLGALLDFSDREDKRLVLIVENMNMIFRDIADPDTAWRLRKTLQTEPRIMLLASATSRFEEIDNPEQALYDLFRVLTLRPLSTQECATLWEKVSGKEPAVKQIRPLEILTGSNPRLLTIIAGFGAALSLRELMKDLFDLVDEHTEYFRSHIESLSAAQERRVYLALAKLWKPANTREIAGLARLDTSQCSAQLQRLIDRGVVSEKGGTPRRKKYYLVERLYNIYYLLRSGMSNQIVEALLQFMVEYYSHYELRTILQNTVTEMKDLNNSVRSNDISQRFIQSLDRYFDKYSDKKEQKIYQLMDEAKRMSDIKNYDKMVNIFDEIDQIYNEIMNESNTIKNNYLDEVVAMALLNKSISLTYLNRAPETIIICDKIMTKFSENNSDKIIEIIKNTMIHKANTLGKLNRIPEEISVCDEYLDKFGNVSMHEMNSQTLQVLINKAVALSYLGKLNESLYIYDNIIEKFINSQEMEIIVIVAHSFTNKAAVLGILKRSEEVIELSDEVIRKFGNIDSSEILQLVVQSFMNKGIALIQLDRINDALELYEKVICKFANSNVDLIIGCVAQALVQKSLILAQIDKTFESLDVCNEMLNEFGQDNSLIMSFSIAQALLHKANLLAYKMNNFIESVDIYNHLINRFMNSNVRQVIDITGMATINKGLILWQSMQPSANVVDHKDLMRYLEDQDTCKRDVQVILGFLAETGHVPGAAIRALLAFGIALGYKAVLALIEEAALKDLLLPLVTAFRREIGLETEVSQEVFEVAEDIRKGLAKVRR